MLCYKTNGKRHGMHYCDYTIALKKQESHSAIASCDSYASFALNNLPRASI